MTRVAPTPLSGGSRRAVSTVLDVCVCLLLVSAAVAAVVSIRRPPVSRGDAADDAATTLATSTATVNYTLVAPPDDATPVSFRSTDGPGFRRTAHGTLARLLAQAAVANATVDGTALTRTRGRFVSRVVAETRRAVARPDAVVQVLVTWTPYRGSSLTGRIVVGPDPPAGTDVHAAVVTVPSGLPAVRDRAMRASSGGYDGVARVVAVGIVDGLLPERETSLALRDGYPANALVAQRYVRTGNVLDATVLPAVAATNATWANDRLVTALSERVAADLRATADSPTAAARGVSVGTVTIVVRTWSA